MLALVVVVMSLVVITSAWLRAYWIAIEADMERERQYSPHHPAVAHRSRVILHHPAPLYDQDEDVVAEAERIVKGE